MNLWLVLGGCLVICFGLIVFRGAPYVPSHKKQLRRAFSELYELSAKDMLVDLGSGDGVVLREARQKNARAIGYELNPFLALISRLLSFNDRLVTVKIRDYLSLDSLPEAVTVVYAFTTSRSIDDIDKKCRQWSAGRQLYFISYGFKVSHKKPVRTIGPMHLYLYK